MIAKCAEWGHGGADDEEEAKAVTGYGGGRAEVARPGTCCQRFNRPGVAARDQRDLVRGEADAAEIGQGALDLFA